MVQSVIRQLYSIETNGLTVDPEPAAIYLAGQPLAWIVPALDIYTDSAQYERVGSLLATCLNPDYGSKR
jgi:hypothetical protein